MKLAAALAFAALAIAGCGRAAPEAPGSAAAPAWAYDREATGGPVSLRLRLDRVEATLADTITIEQELRVEDGFEADFPEYLPEDFEGFSVVEIDTHSGAARADGAGQPARGGAEAASPPVAARRKRLVLEPERSGDLAIAPLAVYFRRAGEARESSFLSEEVPVHVKGLDDVGALALKEPIGIFAAPPRAGGGRVLPWALAGGGAAALAAAGAVLWLRRPRKAPPPVPPHEVAYESLRRLVALGLIEKGEVEVFFVHLSAILRQYIENRFQVRAPERTTEEFLAEAAKNPALEHHRVRLGEFLQLSDQVKFARFRPEAATIQGAFDTLKSFLAETTPDAV
jgi:hypothetical protein